VNESWEETVFQLKTGLLQKRSRATVVDEEDNTLGWEVPGANYT